MPDKVKPELQADNTTLLDDLLEEHQTLWFVAEDAKNLCLALIRTGQPDAEAVLSLGASFQKLEMGDRTLQAMYTVEEGGGYGFVAELWGHIRNEVRDGAALYPAFKTVLDSHRSKEKPDA